MCNTLIVILKLIIIKHIVGFLCCQTINRIQIKVFVYIIYVCVLCIFIMSIINTHTYSIYSENIYMYIHLYIYISIFNIQACDQLETKKKENLTTPQATPTIHAHKPRPQHLLKIYILAH